MVKLILADGTELNGLKQNGNNYVSQTEIDVSVFEDNLSTLTIVDGDTQMVMHNAELIQQVQYTDGWYLCFCEKTVEEKLAAAISANANSVTDVQVALAEVYEMILGGK